MKDSKPKNCIAQGHRGARGYAPENSIEGFNLAFKQGAGRIEVDINITADGQLIVFHDETTNTDIVRSVSAWVDQATPWFALDSSNLTNFDIGRIRPGSHYQHRFSQQKPQDGTRIPTINDLAAFIKNVNKPSPLITMEIKCAPDAPAPLPDLAYFAKQIINALRRLNLLNLVTLQSFNWSIIKEMQKLEPDLIYGCLTSCEEDFDTITINNGNSPWTAGLNINDFGFSMPKMVKAMGVNYWCSEFKDLSLENIQEAHSLGLDVFAWTVNNKADMQKLLDWSVDSIITDYPDILVELLA